MIRRWIRISILIFAVLAFVVAVHRTADSRAEDRLRAALDRLLPPESSMEPATAQDPTATPPILAGLKDAITWCETALGQDRFDRVQMASDPNDPTPIEEVRSILVDAHDAFSKLDAALAMDGGRLPAVWDLHPIELPDLQHLVRLCEADVLVQLHAEDFDRAARSVRRISALADSLEDGHTVMHQLLRFTFAGTACQYARQVLEHAPHPAALGDLTPRSPSSALRRAWSGERRNIHALISEALGDEIDLAALGRFEGTGAISSESWIPFVDPWIKFGLVDCVEYFIEVGNHLEPTRENVTILHALANAIKTDGNRFTKPLVSDVSQFLESEISTRSQIEVVRAGAIAWAYFREHGTWSVPSSFARTVTVVAIRDGIEIRSEESPEVTWKLAITRESEGADAR